MTKDYKITVQPDNNWSVEATKAIALDKMHTGVQEKLGCQCGSKYCWLTYESDSPKEDDQ